MNPPDVTYQPWNSLTLVHSTTETTYTCCAQDVLAMLRKQVDPTGRGFNPSTSGDKRFVVQFKLHSIQAWNLTGKVLALAVDDYSEAQSAAGGRDQLCGLVDTGSQTHTPCVGYLLPASHRQMVIRTDDKQGSDQLFTITSGGGDQLIIYLKIAYRFDGPVTPPKLLLPIGNCINLLTAGNRVNQRVAVRVEGIRDILTSLHEIAENTYESKPSTIEKIVDKVKYVALAVSALGDEEGSTTSSFVNLMAGMTIDEDQPPMPSIDEDK